MRTEDALTKVLPESSSVALAGKWTIFTRFIKTADNFVQVTIKSHVLFNCICILMTTYISDFSEVISFSDFLGK